MHDLSCLSLNTTFMERSSSHGSTQQVVFSVFKSLTRTSMAQPSMAWPLLSPSILSTPWMCPRLSYFRTFSVFPPSSTFPWTALLKGSLSHYTNEIPAKSCHVKFWSSGRNFTTPWKMCKSHNCLTSLWIAIPLNSWYEVCQLLALPFLVIYLHFLLLGLSLKYTKN